VKIGEPHALPRKLIDSRRFDQSLPVTAQFAVAQVIGHDQDDVRQSLCRS
jgi:hypothetical protein